MYKKENIKAFLLMSPGLIGFFMFYILPFNFSVKYAFTDKPVKGEFAGFSNFTNLFGSQPFILGVTNTFKMLVICVPLSLVLALFLGETIHGLFKSRKISIFFMFPMAIPSACTAFLFRSFVSDNGFISRILGVQINWLDTERALLIAVVIYIWKNIGYNLIIILAGIAEIPVEYKEWAAVEGMGDIGYFFKIELPCLGSSIFIMLVMSIINVLKVFKELYMLSGNYPSEGIYMLQHYMNNQFLNMNYQNLTAASLVITVVTGLVLVLASRIILSGGEG